MLKPRVFPFMLLGTYGSVNNAGTASPCWTAHDRDGALQCPTTIQELDRDGRGYYVVTRKSCIVKKIKFILCLYMFLTNKEAPQSLTESDWMACTSGPVERWPLCMARQ